MFSNPSDLPIDPAFDMDDFLPEFDASTFDFTSLPTYEDDSAQELEYFGPPTVAQLVPTSALTDAEEGIEVEEDHLNVGKRLLLWLSNLNMTYSSIQVSCCH
jgi:hypothetical protein